MSSPRYIALLAGLSVLALVAAVGVSQATSIESASATVQATYYVSPSGSDSNSGTIGSPFLTLHKARTVVASINSSMTGDIVVNFRGGDYPFSAPETFGASDSGTNSHNVIYQAYPGETPVFDGGVPVTSWTQLPSSSIWSATLTRSTKLRTLYVNGTRATLARGPVITPLGGSGTYSVTGGSAAWALGSGTSSTEAGIKFSTSDVAASYGNPTGLELVNQVGFSFQVVGLSGISTSGGNRIATLQQPMGAIALSEPAQWGMAYYERSNSPANSFYLQNAFELLDSPGEFYFDNTANKLYYYPRATDNMATAVVNAPTAQGLINVVGTSTSTRAQNIVFSGITFGYTHWSLVDVAGSVGATTIQGNAMLDAYYPGGNWHDAVYDNTTVMPSAVQVTNASGISLTGDTFTHLGAGGVTLGNDAVNSSVTGNVFTDISGSAVTIGDPQNTYIGDGDIPVAKEGAPTNDSVENNFIDHAAAEFLQCAGIMAYYTVGLDVSHNVVADLPYTGISLGWGWDGYAGYGTPPVTPSHVAQNNTISDNAVYNVVQSMHDGGGIYTLGLQPGTKVTSNYVDNVGSNPDPAGGFYSDQGSSGMEVSGNVFEDLHGGAWWVVWGPGAENHNMDVHDNFADQVSGTEGQYAIDSTSVHNGTSWSQLAEQTVANAGVQSAYASIVPAGFNPGTRQRGLVQAESGATYGGSSVSVDSGASGGKIISGLSVTGSGVTFSNVTTATAVALHYAATSSGHISLYVNGTKVGTTSFTSTGSLSQPGSDASTTVGIPEGSTVSVQFDSGDTALNLDYVTFTRTQGSFIEAESGTLLGRAVVNTSSGTNNGEVVAQLDTVGDGVSFANVEASTELTVRYSAAVAGHESVYVNGTKVGTISFTSTGGWFGPWGTARAAFSVPAGATLKIQNATGDTGFNLDSIQLSRLEGEDGVLSPGLSVNPDIGSASGGEIVAGLGAPNRNVTFKDVPAATHLVVGYDSGASGSLSVYVNGSKMFPSVGDNFTFTSTGGWTGNYTTVNYAIDIPQGATLTISYDIGDSAFNLDYLDLE